MNVHRWEYTTRRLLPDAGIDLFGNQNTISYLHENIYLLFHTCSGVRSESVRESERLNRTRRPVVIIGRAATYAGPDSSASLRRRRADPSSLRATCRANHPGSVRPWRWPLRCFFQRQQRKCESAAGTPHTALGTSSQLRIGHAGPRRAFVDPIGRRPRNL